MRAVLAIDVWNVSRKYSQYKKHLRLLEYMVVQIKKKKKTNTGFVFA